MKKFLISLLTVSAVIVVVVYATNAYFSDTEVSRDNTFTAGAIDLLIDNESWYHGPDNEGLVRTHKRDDLSWQPADLEGHLFFSFSDIKPGDWGEDTISVRVDNNDAYVCADFTLTSNEENDITEPEEDLNDDDTTGELAGELNFVWWADDKDNVFEQHESIITQANLGDAWLNQTHTVTLADSQTNVWLGTAGPIEGETTYHIGKFWCFGDITINPVFDGVSPEVNPGFLCNGEPVSNVSQTDSATMDVGFYAVQSRHNEGFLCDNDNRTFLRLENKTLNWVPIVDERYGELVFNSSGSTFDFHLDVYKLDAVREYALHYYKDPWPSNGGKIIHTFTTDASGDWSGSASVELNANLPVDNTDGNWPDAKIWVVPTSDLNPDGSMSAWNQADLLFEWNLVQYDDTDV